MEFSASQYQAVIDKINKSLRDIENAVTHVKNIVDHSFLSAIPIIGGGAKWLFDKFAGLVRQIVRKAEGFLRPARIPVTMDGYGRGWLNIHEQMGGIASTLEQQVGGEGKKTWQGLAGGAYQTGVSQQVPACNAIGSTANTVAGVCTAIRNFGYGFYIAIAAALVAVAFAIASAETVVGAIVGCTGALIAMAAALASLYLGVDSQARSLKGQLGANSNFPGGRWPQATTS